MLSGKNYNIKYSKDESLVQYSNATDHYQNLLNINNDLKYALPGVVESFGLPKELPGIVLWPNLGIGIKGGEVKLSPDSDSIDIPFPIFSLTDESGQVISNGVQGCGCA